MNLLTHTHVCYSTGYTCSNQDSHFTFKLLFYSIINYTYIITGKMKMMLVILMTISIGHSPLENADNILVLLYNLKCMYGL